MHVLPLIDIWICRENNQKHNAKQSLVDDVRYSVAGRLPWFKLHTWIFKRHVLYLRAINEMHHIKHDHVPVCHSQERSLGAMCHHVNWIELWHTQLHDFCRANTISLFASNLNLTERNLYIGVGVSMEQVTSSIMLLSNRSS